MPVQFRHEVVIGHQVLQKIQNYHKKLKTDPFFAGKYLREQILQAANAQGLSVLHYLNTIPTEVFVELIVNSKQHKLLAETELKADGSDWNVSETEILSGIVFSVQAKAYENAGYGTNRVDHENPLPVKLIYTPAPMLAMDFTAAFLPEHLEMIESRFSFFPTAKIQHEIEQKSIGSFDGKESALVLDVITYLKNGYGFKNEVITLSKSKNVKFTKTFVQAVQILKQHGLIEIDINQNAFQKYYRENYLPALFKINAELEVENKGKVGKERKLAINYVPGLGCGYFAGWFEGTGKVEKALEQAFVDIIKSEGLHTKLNNFRAIYFVPYKKPKTEGKAFNWSNRIEGFKNSNFSFLVRPASNLQNCSAFDTPDKFKQDPHLADCENELVIVTSIAADQESWPGNDFYLNIQQSQEGYTASKTNVMTVFTGAPGSFIGGKYLPDEDPNKLWINIAHQQKARLNVCDTVWVLNKNNQIVLLNAELPAASGNDNASVTAPKNTSPALRLINYLYFIERTITDKEYQAGFDAAGNLNVSAAASLNLIFKAIKNVWDKGVRIIDPANPLYVDMLAYFENIAQADQSYTNEEIEQLKTNISYFLQKLLGGNLAIIETDSRFVDSLVGHARLYLQEIIANFDTRKNVKEIFECFNKYLPYVTAMRPLFSLPHQINTEFLFAYVKNIHDCLKTLLELGNEYFTNDCFNKLVESFFEQHDSLKPDKDNASPSQLSIYDKHVELLIKLLKIYENDFDSASSILSHELMYKLATKVMGHENSLLVYMSNSIKLISIIRKIGNNIILVQGQKTNPTFHDIVSLKVLLEQHRDFMRDIFSAHKTFFVKLDTLSTINDCEELTKILQDLNNLYQKFSNNQIVNDFLLSSYQDVFKRIQLINKFENQDVVISLNSLLNAMLSEVVEGEYSDNHNFFAHESKYKIDPIKLLNKLDDQVKQLNTISKALIEANTYVTSDEPKDSSLLISALADAQATFYDAPTKVSSAFRVFASTLAFVAIGLGATLLVMATLSAPLLAIITIPVLWYAIGATVGGGLVGLAAGLGVFNPIYLNKSANDGLNQDKTYHAYLNFEENVKTATDLIPSNVK